MNKLKSYWYFRGCLLRFPSLSAAKSHVRTIQPSQLHPYTIMDPWLYHSVNDKVVGKVHIQWTDKGNYYFTRPQRL